MSHHPVLLVAFLIAFISAVAALEATSVAVSDRRQWCTIQIASCQNICVDKSSSSRSNDCNYETLAYNCVCSNNFTPDAKTYTQTIPYFICQHEEQLCEKNCAAGSDATCVVNCRKTHFCVATNPPRSNSTVTPTVATPVPTGTTTDAGNNRLAISVGSAQATLFLPATAIAVVAILLTALA